jgi:hypothetical protein
VDDAENKEDLAIETDCQPNLAAQNL